MRRNPSHHMVSTGIQHLLVFLTTVLLPLLCCTELAVGAICTSNLHVRDATTFPQANVEEEKGL